LATLILTTVLGLVQGAFTVVFRWFWFGIKVGYLIKIYKLLIKAQRSEKKATPTAMADI